MKSYKETPLFTIFPGEVHVWQVDIKDFSVDASFCEQVLSSEESIQARGYKFGRDRQNFIIRRFLLRQLLSRYTQKAPEALEYESTSHGKLYLADGSIFFNHSHSFERVVYAFTVLQQIGIDIEKIHPMPDLQGMIGFCLSKEERNCLLSYSSDTQLDSFFHVWTQKEAYIKARGRGLAIPLQDFSVSADPNKPGNLLGDSECDQADWRMVTIVPEPGWRIAVCIQSTNPLNVVWHELEKIQITQDNKVDFSGVSNKEL